MSLCLILGCIETCTLKNYIDVKIAPRKVVSVCFLVDLDLVTINDDGMICVRYLISLSITSLRRIILQKVSQHVRGCQIVDCNDIKTLCLEHLSKCKTSNTTETINRNSYCHISFLLIILKIIIFRAFAQTSLIVSNQVQEFKFFFIL